MGSATPFSTVTRLPERAVDSGDHCSGNDDDDDDGDEY